MCSFTPVQGGDAVGVWDTYQSRIDAKGGDRRSAAIQRERRALRTKIEASPSFRQVLIDGQPRSLSVLSSDYPNQKALCTLPGEMLPHGGIVEWVGYHWLITETDPDTELYAKGKMLQCNYLLQWITDEGDIEKRWSIVEDGTRYLVGEYGDKDFIITRGDSRISLTLPKDRQTLRLSRKNRFLIDDYQSPNVIAYRLTKPYKLGGSYDETGVLHFVLQECATEDTDNFELHIANYYDYFPRKGGQPTGTVPPPPTGGNVNGKKVWL